MSGSLGLEANTDVFPVRLPHYTVRGGIIYFLGKPVYFNREAANVLGRCRGHTPASKLMGAEDVIDDLEERGMILSLEAPLAARRHRPAAEDNKGLIVFSPHCDDAALSLGALLASRARDTLITIVTIFSKSRYTILDGLSKRATEVTRIRKAEDRFYARLIGAELAFLNLPEALLRGRDNAMELIIWRYGEQERRLKKQLKLAFARLIAGFTGAKLFFPLGLGHHIDHVLVRDAAIEWLLEERRLANEVAFYEDLPYASIFNDLRPALEFIRSCGLETEARLFDVSPYMEVKLRNLRAYRSQIAPGDLQHVENYAARLFRWHGSTINNNQAQGYCERLWFVKTSRS